jgi:hypothetical protein
MRSESEGKLTRNKCPLCGDHHTAEEGIVLYVREFNCSRCGEEWTDRWCSDCNDKCPDCNAEIEPLPDSSREVVFEQPLT